MMDLSMSHKFPAAVKTEAGSPYMEVLQNQPAWQNLPLIQSSPTNNATDKQIRAGWERSVDRDFAQNFTYADSKSIPKATAITVPPNGSRPCYVNEILLLMAGELYDNWRHVGTIQRLTSDIEIASFLVQHYRKMQADYNATATCADCHAALKLLCPGCHVPASCISPQQANESQVKDSTIEELSRGGDADQVKSLTPSPGDMASEYGGDSLPEMVGIMKQDTLNPVSRDENVNCPSDWSDEGELSPAKTNKTEVRHSNITVKKKVGRPRKNSLEVKSRSCKECETEFPTLTKLRQHQRGTHGKKKLHKCEHCSASFSNRNNLIVHVRKHTGERPFKCEHCDKAFARNTTLIQHMRIHTNECPFKCQQCSEAFKQRGQLIIHQRKHTGEKPFKCSLCEAAFIAMGRLTAHMMTHSGKRPFLCEECGASFTQKGILKAHRLTHTGERAFSCDQCGKRFYRNNDLRAHQRTHTGVRDFACRVCGQTFLAASNLRRHMQKHTGHRPHPCQECGKFFASKSELKVHTRIHTGHKPYVCQECGKGFITSGNMMKHFNNRHRPKTASLPSQPSMDVRHAESVLTI